MGILIRNLFIQTPKFTWKKKLKNYSPFILSRYSEGGLCHAIERARMLSMISAEYRAWPKVETQLLILQCCLSLIPLDSVKFLYSEKVTKFCGLLRIYENILSRQSKRTRAVPRQLDNLSLYLGCQFHRKWALLKVQRMLLRF